MSLYAQVTLLTAGTDPADNQSNGFAADAQGITTTDLDDWLTAIKDFYDDVLSVGALRSLAQNGHIVKIYDVTLPAPNYPIYENTFNLGGAVGDIDMPLEVSLAISYKNTINNNVPRARRRGRIFISGWAETQNLNGRPAAGTPNGLATAYATYVAAVNAIGSLDAGVWSRTDNVVYPIDEVWVDDEWDTVRRRGRKATSRVTISV